MHILQGLAQFRQAVYHTFTQRATALLEVIDAVAQVPQPHSPAELSRVMQRHWTTLYGDLDRVWDYNPSIWPQRLPIVGLALGGFGIATYLALYQLDILSTVWEPFFGNGSRIILGSERDRHELRH